MRHAGAPHLSTSLPRARSPNSSLLARSRNGGNGKVFYIDTEGTFRPDRMRPIAERFGMDPDGVLDNIIYARMHTHDQQMEIMTAVAAKIAEDAVNYSLMVRLLPRILCTHPSPAPRPPPTPILPLAPDRGQRDGALPRRLQRPRRALGAAAKAGQAPVQHYQECAGAARFGVDAGLTHRRAVAEEFNIAVLLVNQVCADPGATAVFVKDPKKPVGGNVRLNPAPSPSAAGAPALERWPHAMPCPPVARRSWPMRRRRASCSGRELVTSAFGACPAAGSRRCTWPSWRPFDRTHPRSKVYDSPSLPESEATFAISAGGIADIE